MKPYDHKEIEHKWQEIWDKEQSFAAQNDSSKPKYYALVEFPYPSGEGLHVGHPRPYIGLDLVARKRRAEGFNVLYPMGWDAFGLPAENYAIKTGVQPAVTTKKNIDNFRRQMQMLGLSFDWSREINTTDPKYYKWTQWIFLQFLRAGLAYKAKAVINWCPKDKIGLANEEVIDGKCERCGTPVEKREKEQWMLAITKYADRLDKDLDTVDYLPQIKAQQRNWIGRSEGAEIDFALDFKMDLAFNDNRGPDGGKAHIKVFTTRPDTIFGATYLVLAPEHLWVTLAIDDSHKGVLENAEEVRKYVEASKQRDDISRADNTKAKTGVEVKGVKAVNPATKEEIPIYVADYVLPHYGTGAIMAVPAHDERDYEFAKKNGLSIKEVIEPSFDTTRGPDAIHTDEKFEERDTVVCVIKHWSEDKYICLDWKNYGWKTFVVGGTDGEPVDEAARREIIEESGYTNIKSITLLGGRIHNRFYARHKNVNRWAKIQPVYVELVDGTRIEIGEEEKTLHEVKWIEKEKVSSFLFDDASDQTIWKRAQGIFPPVIDTGILVNSGQFDGADSETAKKSILESVGGKMVTTFKLRDWVFSRQRYWGEPIPVIHCEKCGYVPVPEDQLPVTLPEVERYEPTDTGESPLASIDEWVNTACPTCGGPAKRETDTMPNWAGSSWYYLRYTDPHNDAEFASQKDLKYWTPVDWYNGGMEHTTLHLLYSRFWHKFLFDQGLVPTAEPYMKRTSHGLILAEGGVKMSKSKGNVVNPDEIVDLYGADTLRLYEMFMGPFTESVAWSTESIIGPRRFLERVWRMAEQIMNNESRSMEDSVSELPVTLSQTIQKVSDDIESMSFNTAVSALMICLNAFEKSESVSKDQFGIFLQLLAPFAPHISEELWQSMGNAASIQNTPWPKADLSKLIADIATLAIQVNGKVRATMTVASDISEKDAQVMALQLPEIQKWIGDGEVKKMIYVKGRLINFVL